MKKEMHTPEKLEVYFDGMSHLIKEALPTGYNIARTHFGVERNGVECEPGNARRLVACWNACQGIETGILESLPLNFKECGLELGRLQEQNGRLLDALKEAMPIVKHFIKNHDFTTIEKMEAAIAENENP